MANVQSDLKDWSTIEANNQPDAGDATTIVGDLRAIQAGVRYMRSQDTIASSATTDLGSKKAESLTISGTTTITALGTVSAGIVKRVVFSGALTLTHNGTSLILPKGGENITTVAGDAAEFESLGSGNWRCNNYSKNTADAPIDLTSYSGADVELAIGEMAYYNVVADSSVNLRIANTQGCAYEYGWEAYNIEAVSGSTSSFTLFPNNLSYGTEIGVFIRYSSHTGGAASQVSNQGAFPLGIINVGITHNSSGKIYTSNAGKQVTIDSCRGSQPTIGYVGYGSTIWLNTTTNWTTLGTIDFGTDLMTGRFWVRRIL